MWLILSEIFPVVSIAVENLSILDPFVYLFYAFAAEIWSIIGGILSMACLILSFVESVLVRASLTTPATFGTASTTLSIAFFTPGLLLSA